MAEKVMKCHPKSFIEKTLAIIKPEALKNADVIEDIILRTGFSIINVSTSNVAYIC